MSKNSDNGVIVPDNREYEEKIKSLHTGAALIGRAGSTKELYNSITKTLNNLLGYPLSGLTIPDKDHIHFVKTIHESHGIDFSLPLDVPTISTRAYREKTTQIVNDVREDPDYYSGQKGAESGPVVLSSLVVPILVEDKVRALLNVESAELAKFSQMDVEILEILGMHISSAFIRIDQINEIFESETRLQAIMRQAADAIILMDIKDNIIFWNPAAERLFEYKMIEALDNTFLDLLVPEEFKKKYTANRNMMLGMDLGTNLPLMECVCQKKSGENIVVEVSHSMVMYDGIPHILRMVRDVSERKIYERRLELLYEHASNLSQAKNVYDIFKITREVTSTVFGANHGSIALVNKGYLVFVSDRPKEAWWRTPLDGKGIGVRAVRTGETQLVRDVRTDPNYTVDTTEEYKNEMRSELDVPIKIEGEVIGIFNVESSLPDRFTDQDVKMMDIFVESITATISRLRADEERTKFEDKLESLHRSAIILNNAQTKEELFESTITILKEVLGTHWVGIAEPVMEGMRLALASEYSREEDFILPYDAKSIVLRSYNKKQTVFVEDLANDPDYVSVEEGIQYISELVVPVFVDNKIIALINVESTVKDEIGQPERELVEILALYMGSAINRIQRTKVLRESEERIRILSQNAVDAIFVVNKEREFIMWNTSMKTMFGLSEDDFNKNKLENLIIPKDRWESFYEEFGNIIERRIDTSGKVLESVALKADGTEIQVGYTTSVIELNGEPHAMFIMRNTTAQKEQRDKIFELNAELERSNQDLENYTYVVSHDLKAPLRSIRSFGGFIMEDNADQLDEEGKEYLDRIINAATHMDNLISDLLLLSRVGRKFTEVEEISLNEVIDSIEEDIYATIEERNAQIIRDYLPTVIGQKTWIRQLFMNLTTNGLKFNKSASPTITIKVDENESEYTFSVKDNGIGIPKEYHDKIFQLFERLHTTTEYEGTGAGLAICKKIVDNLRGRLWVESEEGKGSTFYFTYPKEEVGV